MQSFSRCIGKRWRSLLFGILCLTLIAGNSIHKSTKGDLPRVTVDRGEAVLLLPESLTKVINRNFPGFRVPTREDMTGEWATRSKKYAVPYACWGDFTGNGFTDIALILLGKDRWKLVMFNQTAKGEYEAYEARGYPGPDIEFTTVHPAQRFHIYTLSAGQKLKVDGSSVRLTQRELDTIIFSLLEDARSGIQFVWFPKFGSYDATVRFGNLTD